LRTSAAVVMGSPQRMQRIQVPGIARRDEPGAGLWNRERMQLVCQRTGLAQSI
jgi:hypothetical protein